MNHLVPADELALVRFVGNKPRRQHPGDAGFDLINGEDDAFLIDKGATQFIRTGTKIALPWWTVGLVCSRSGLAKNHGIHVLNSPGVIDPSYRGEIGVVLHNAGSEPYIVTHGERIAQLVIVPTLRFEFEYDEEFVEDDTHRGPRGFGSTGNAA